MLYRVFAAMLLSCLPGAADSQFVAYLFKLLPNFTVRAIAVGTERSVYLAGQEAQPSSSVPSVVIAKLSADATTLLYKRALPVRGTGSAVVLDADDNLYVAGTSQDESGVDPPRAFVVKLNPQGSLVYSFALPRDGAASGTDLAVNSGGEVFFTGLRQTGNALAGYLAKLAATGNLLWTVEGIGGAHVALDKLGNPLVAGNSASTVSTQRIGTGSGCNLRSECGHQSICKVNVADHQVAFCTVLTGNGDDSNNGLGVDSSGSVYVAGTTTATNYPVTDDALQRTNRAFNFPAERPTSGFLSKLSADGSSLLYSTYLGGSSPDRVTSLTLSSSGEVTVGMQLQSSDIAGLPDVAAPCLPGLQRLQPAIVRMSGGSTAAAGDLTLLQGVTPCADCGPLLTQDAEATVYVTGASGYIARRRQQAQSAYTPLGCIVDAADLTQVGAVSPGQALSLFGRGIGPAEATQVDTAGDVAPAMLGSVSVTFNQFSGPIFVATPDQVSTSVPFEIASESSAVVSLFASPGFVVTRELPVVPRAPSLYRNRYAAQLECANSIRSATTTALVLNEDYSINSCAHPANNGGLVSVYFNGLGLTSLAHSVFYLPQAPEQTSGPRIAPVPGGVTFTLEALNTVPGLPFGSWEARLRLSPAAGPAVPLAIAVDGVPIRQQNLLIWIH